MLNQTALTLANVSWLLVAMGFVIAPHVARLPVWVSAVCIAAGAWRWWVARRGLRTPPWWVMALIAVGVAAGARLEYGRLLGREVGVTLLIVMLCLKVLEMRMKRDATVAIFLGFFLAMTNFLYSQTILMGLYMLVCVWLFVATLVGFNRINTEPTLRERIRPAFWLLVQALPMMLVLFFLFPRLSGPLWRMPGDDSSTTGLSEEMAPGDISKLSQSEAVAFRVDFDSVVPQNEDLYWRGPVLGEHVGRSWRMYAPERRRDPEYQYTDAPISYRVTMQPSNKFWLFALDLPAARVDNADITDDFQLRSRTPVSSLRTYQMSSHLRYTYGRAISDRDRARYLGLSTNINPRSMEYAKQLRADNPDPRVLIEKLMARYNKEFEYTLEPPRLGANPVDEFLFDSKKGFCEHYAGSFVFVLRAAGIPARVVTGYQGGEINPITRQLVVRQAEAHAWAEVWLDGIGWARADPTFAVSPLRINRGMTEALGPIGMLNTMMDADKFGLLKQIAFSWDAVNNQWNQWVIGFNQDRQSYAMELFFGLKEVDWRDLAKALLIGVFITGSLAALFLIWHSYRTRKSPVVMAWERFCRKLAKADLPRAPHEGPLDYLQRICRERPALTHDATAVIRAYVDLRYGAPASSRATVSGLAALVRRFRAQ
jgi:transglutaminase-like putative cysteine protease